MSIKNSTALTSSQQGTLSGKENSLRYIVNGVEEFILDRDGIIISSNLEAVNVTGFEEYEVMGKSISLLYPTNGKRSVQDDLDRAVKLGSIIITDMLVKKRDVRFWGRMKIVFLGMADAGLPAFRVLVQDTTHKALSRTKLKTIRDEYLAIFNNPFIGAIKFNVHDSRVIMSNKRALDILNQETSGGTLLKDCFAIDTEFEAFIRELKSTHRIESFKFLTQNLSSREERWVLISARFFERQGFAEGILLDVTAQHRQMLDLTKVNQELDHFIYRASHDLRSPLTSLMGLVNLSFHEVSTQHPVQAYLKMMQDRIQHMDALLKDLIAISYDKEASTRVEGIDFQSEIKQIINVFTQADAPVQVSVSVDQPVEFQSDPIRVRTILRNLISNSFKYMNPTQAHPSISIKVRIKPTHCSLQIRDNGIGIASEFKARVYDMFFRATERSTGTGLGLYIVKSMVEKLEGTISFESTPNVGTTFLLIIPNHTLNLPLC